MRTRTVVAALATFALGLGVMPQAVAAPDELRERTSARAAHRALADARAVLDRSAATQPADGRDASLVLRDLALNLDDLSAADRNSAERILSRPTDGGADPQSNGYAVAEATPVCGTDTCVHYVTSTSDAPALTDSGGNGVPDYVDSVLATVEHVHDVYVAAGYRQPKSDGTTGGGSALTDIYLADLGTGLYGYCAPEGSGSAWDRQAYCVLDDDYVGFPRTQLANVQVTAAHEYFHAVQYAYDATEASWFMEATATWAEDEVYDAVDDNVQYLRFGQIGRPDLSLDRSYTNGNHYGNWIFFRYLTEKYRASAGGMPTLVRSMWSRADGSAGGPDQFALQAVVNTVKAAGGDFTKVYAGFADANRRPRKAYDEGAAERYPTAPLAFRALKLSAKTPRTTWGAVKLNHLTSATASFAPKKLKHRKWKLKVQVDMAARSRGSLAVVSVYFKGGRVTSRFIRLNGMGKGARSVAFSSRKVSRVDAVLVNASTRGAADDRLTQKIRARAFR